MTPRAKDLYYLPTEVRKVMPKKLTDEQINVYRMMVLLSG